MTYNPGDDWTVVLQLVPGSEVTFKYVVRWHDSSDTWENGSNRTYTVPNADATYNVGWQA